MRIITITLFDLDMDDSIRKLINISVAFKFMLIARRCSPTTRIAKQKKRDRKSKSRRTGWWSERFKWN